MSTRVRLTIDVDVQSMAYARSIAENTDELRTLIMRGDAVEGVDVTAEIIYDYAPQHEHLKENLDVD